MPKFDKVKLNYLCSSCATRIVLVVLHWLGHAVETEGVKRSGFSHGKGYC